MTERKEGAEPPPLASPKVKTKPVPKAVRILENKTLAHGAGLIVLRQGQRIDDPWVIHAVLMHSVAHAVLE